MELVLLENVLSDSMLCSLVATDVAVFLARYVTTLLFLNTPGVLIDSKKGFFSRVKLLKAKVPALNLGYFISADISNHLYWR